MIKGIGTFLPPTVNESLLFVLVKRNWNVMSSLASPLLSRWISYSALESSWK
jgi:hypothetical protein